MINILFRKYGLQRLYNFSRELLFCMWWDIVKSQPKNVSDYVKKVYFAYFIFKLGDQNTIWALIRCAEDAKKTFDCRLNKFKQRNNTIDCYFCSINLKRFNRKNKKMYTLTLNQLFVQIPILLKYQFHHQVSQKTQLPWANLVRFFLFTREFFLRVCLRT